MVLFIRSPKLLPTLRQFSFLCYMVWLSDLCFRESQADFMINLLFNVSDNGNCFSACTLHKGAHSMKFALLSMKQSFNWRIKISRAQRGASQSALPSAPVFSSLSVRQSVTRARNVTVFVTSYISDQVATEPRNKCIYSRQIESHLSLISLCCFLFVTFSMVTISLQTTNSSVLRLPVNISLTKPKWS